MRAKKVRFSLAVRVGYTAIDCGTSPSAPRAAAAPAGSACPSTVTDPSSAASSVATIDKVVDFPAPLGPSSPTTSPGATAKLTPSSATRAP